MMKIEVNSPAYGAFRGGKQDIAAVTVTRDGENITINFTNTKGREIPAHIVLPASIAEQFIHAINCAREKVVAEHSGIQMYETWADGSLDIILRVTDAEAAEVWRGKEFDDWLEAAGVENKYAFVHGYTVFGYGVSGGYRLLYEYELSVDDGSGNPPLYDAEYIFEDDGPFPNPIESIFQAERVVFRNIR